MVTGMMLWGMMLWNEPNNLSHWDFEMDPEWKEFSTMTRLAARAIRISSACWTATTRHRES